MAHFQLTHVKKRDGRLVPFESDKLVRSLLAAATACGIAESFYARELADAAALHLAQSTGDANPTTDTIAATVEKILSELRFNQIADAYRAYRAEREHSRARCTVVKPLQPSLLAGESTITVTFSQDQRSAPWDRARIVRALEREAHVPRTAAEDIARAVEEKLLSSDLRHVTTTLIRALADNELLARGYSSVLRQRSAVTIPFADIDALIADARYASLASCLGRQAIKPYVLTRVFSDDVAMAHRRGMIHIHGLDHPLHRHAALLPAQQPVAAIRAAGRDMLGRLMSGQAGSVIFQFDTDDSLQSLPELAGWFAGISGVARVRFAVPAHCISRLVDVVDGVDFGAPLQITLHGMPQDPAIFAQKMAMLSRIGWLAAWQPAAPSREWSQHITVNLPQAIYRARQHDLDATIEEVYRSVDLAATAHRQYVQFAIEHGQSPPSGAGVVTVAGLNEAISILTGAGMFDGSDSRACVRVLLSVLQNTLHRAAQANGFDLLLVLGDPGHCVRRLAAVDQSLFPELFGFLPLQADSLESVIPPYSAIAIAFDDPASVDAIAEAASVVCRYFDAGALPIHVDEQATSGLPHLVSRLMHHASPFELVAGTPPAQHDHRASSDQLPLPGIRESA